MSYVSGQRHLKTIYRTVLKMFQYTCLEYTVCVGKLMLSQNTMLPKLLMKSHICSQRAKGFEDGLLFFIMVSHPRVFVDAK